MSAKRRSHIKRAKLFRSRILNHRNDIYRRHSQRWFRTLLPLRQAMDGYYQG